MGEDASRGTSSGGPLDPEERARIVAKFECVLTRNRGRIAVPESQLPAPRDRVREALLANAEAEAQGGEVPRGRMEFYKAALLELEAFVSDRSARLLEDYEHAKARGEQWPSDERERAERILRLIQARQNQAIATWIRPDDLERTPALMALEESPVVIGAARRSLDAVAEAQGFQAAAWVMTFLDMAAAAAAFVIHDDKHPGAWLVALYVLPILLIGGPLWMALGVRAVLMLISRARLGRVSHGIARTLVLCAGLVVPAAGMILPILYLFSPSSAAPAAANRCRFDLQARVTKGADAGLSITGQIRFRLAPPGSLSGVLVENNRTSVPVSGSVIQTHELGLAFDVAGGKAIVGTLAPFRGCSDRKVAGTFRGPRGWNTQKIDRGDWSLIQTTRG